MRPWVLAVAAAVVAAAAVPTLSAQSLAEVAARNKKKEAKPAKVYTEDDLRGRTGSSGAMSQMDGPATVAPRSAPTGGAAVRVPR